ncbi:MAG: P-loop NTPase [Kiritimatiellia bacterium]
MSEECTHDCSSCGKDCSSRQGQAKPDFSAPLNAFSSVGKVVAVASGKGGVGKSFVTAMLAVLAARRGLKAAVLDADITGPSIPRAFGMAGGTCQDERGILAPASAGGVKVMSLNLLVEHPEDPVVWRGPVIAGAVKQFWTDVCWGDVDVMFVDMPPGTGDVPLTVFQSLPVDSVVVACSPQELVGMIVEKSVRMAGMLDKKVAALVENMSYFQCPDCGKRHEIFGRSRVEELAKRHGIAVAARLPIDPAFAAAVDAGRIESLDVPGLAAVADAVLSRGEVTE